jgi:hypothetical protein
MASGVRDGSCLMSFRMGLLANLLILGPIAIAAFLETYAPELYALSAREDGSVEWASFWAFMAAGGFFFAGALRQRRKNGGIPWCFIGLGLFCFAFAMEEISWGQRLFGYRPPAYFLEHNFQQELNVHNVIEAGLRRRLFEGIVAGYGVALPLLAMTLRGAGLLSRAGVVTVPPVLIPAFLVMILTFASHPLGRWGEWVECALGLAFLFVAIIRRPGWGWGTPLRRGGERQGLGLFVAWLIVVGLGIATACIPLRYVDSRGDRSERAGIEMEALKSDFVKGEIPTWCGLQKLLYRFVWRYGHGSLREGEFSRLTARGMPADRAAFFLDPWEMPYRIRDSCTEDERRRLIVLHSTGPNRRVDSTSWEIRGDDLRVVIRKEEVSGDAWEASGSRKP